MLRLPVVSSDTALPPPSSGDGSAPPIERAARMATDGTSVLVVEDNADSREMLRMLLEVAGFRCRAADGGAPALRLIEELRPEIAILDLGLPGLNGFELARKIRQSELGKDTCLIALTGYGQPSDRELTREAGFDAHLVKPVQAEELVSLLNRMRPRARSSDALEQHPPA